MTTNVALLDHNSVAVCIIFHRWCCDYKGCNVFLGLTNGTLFERV